MNVGMIVGLGLAIGITFLLDCASEAGEANAPSVPVAAAPISLVPDAYTAFAAPVVVRPSSASVTIPVYAPSPPRLLPPSAPAPVAESRAVPAPVAEGRTAPSAVAENRVVAAPGAESRAGAPAVKPNQYHPHWLVDVH
jgi:hypothetical protein